jgi:CRISPR-associated protein Csb2
MLTLEIEFLTGRYRATSYRSRQVAEWPPHPSRVFSALVASLYESDLGAPAREALLWLEQQPPPEVSASRATERDTVVHFVPVNDESLPVEYRNRQPRSFPAVQPDSTLVHFIWPDALPPLEIRAALDRIAECTTYLGHSSSLVRAAFSDTAGVLSTHRVSADGDMLLRVPKTGRLQSLDQDFRLGRRPSAGPGERYELIDPTTPVDPVESSFGEMIVFRCVEGPAIPITATINLTSILRDAVLFHAGPDAPAIFHGHDEQPHLACIALPYVGSQYADGHLMGVAAVLPRGISRNERREVLSVLSRIQKLTLGTWGEWTIEQQLEPGRAETLTPATWSRPSKIWASVTPVVFDRFPKDRIGQEAADIIAKSCTRIGLPSPQRAEILDASKFSGVPPSKQFRAQRREGDKPRLFSHVVLHFEQPVRGPIILGASRFFGLGLFRPWKGKAS